MISGLPERLKELRKKNGLSQRTVAERLSVSKSVVAAYEVGDRTPSVDVLISLSYLYNCSIDYLVGKKKSVYEGRTLDLSGLTDKQIEALETIIREFKQR